MILIDANSHNFLSQRVLPSMALIQPRFNDNHDQLILSAPGKYRLFTLIKLYILFTDTVT